MKRKLLLAEDDPSVRTMLARVLAAAGYEVFVAAGTREAVSSFCNMAPDLVLMDLNTPADEGWQIFEAIRRLDAGVPVVAMTAWSNQCEVAVLRGIDALMEKPLDLPLLLRLIDELLAETSETRNQRREQHRPIELSKAAA